jgi:hypothetical protein
MTLFSCVLITDATLARYQAAVLQRAGRIVAGGMTKEVSFEAVNGLGVSLDGSLPLNDLIDDACRAKYPGSAYLDPMIGARARSATIRNHSKRQHGRWVRG